MKQIAFIILLIQLLGCNNSSNNIGGIPFEYDGYVILSTKINDSITARLIFDNTSNWMILDSAFVSKYGFSKLKTKNALLNGAGNEGIRHINLIYENICYQIGTYKFNSKFNAILNLKSMTDYSIDGFMGIDFGKNPVIKLDFFNQKFYPDSIKHLDSKYSLPIKFIQNQILIPIETVLENGKQINGYFLLDFGSQGALTFTNEFAQKHGFNKIISKKTKYISNNGGICGKSSGYDFRAKYVKIGNVKFNRPVLDYTLDSSGALSYSNSYIGIVGLEFLSRANITIDFDQKLIYLEPNSKISDKFISNKIGFAYLRQDNNEIFKVAAIRENSFAEKSGLRLGDTIIQINDKRLSSFTNDELRRLFQSDQKIHFKFLKSGQKIDINLIPKEEI